MTKSVCIIGAGPSGLVAAKSLLHDVGPGTFKVTIFDSQSRIGGLWPASKTDNGGLVHPLMVANQSKHTVQFSDLAWEPSAPQLPRAWQVGQYLERYRQRYLQAADLRLGHKVVATEVKTGGSWEIQTSSEKGVETSVFDCLIVSTGFFGQPIWPEDIPRKNDVPIIHSSRYRTLQDLLPRDKPAGGKILVVGGQMSGIEIAGTVATHLSTAINTPDDKPIAQPEKYKIHHVAHRPAWVLPLFTSPTPKEAAPFFLPCDLPSYNLAGRPKPLTNKSGSISEEAAQQSNGIFKVVLGTDQSEFSPQTAIQGDLLDAPPYLAVSEHYLDFVRSGLIEVSKGKVSGVSGSAVTISPSGERIEDVAAVILATGFDPAASISFLPSAVQEAISFDPSNVNLPAALAFHGTHHPTFPSLGFVGFYRSPYWGVMEMQARFVAQMLLGSEAKASLEDTLDQDKSIEHILHLRSDPRTAQFPTGDYPFIMQEFGNALGIQISEPLPTPELPEGKAMDILTPARYVMPGLSREQQDEVDKNLASTNEAALGGLTKAKFVAHAVFRSLLGDWILERDLISKLPSHPSGRFVGVAKFLLREGTADGRSLDKESDPGMEYLYIEDGDFTASNGMKFRATRRYIWRFNDATDTLSVWFARTDDNSRADYLFHDVEFLVPDKQPSSAHKCWHAKAAHLCIDDMYNVKYEFNFGAVNLKDWRLAYTVNGPKKDYTIDGTYRRA
ncbi:uncharacterized protein B0I36DRAFT_84036 [Microdochium trichocladiopsis]|uniref:DUF6314 domain-containing protein n=1 Tax=Microdochium trichocladiopsis TaxID=1682393 RepID=A0A9P8YBE1_9PEZI|nr:uncharacterized protein B0I36DRAFT_84036 [Microdochium trichocladiopsis]KAH7034775.1 hypothetical protein B0I36DRAFT_84036 [Microdochium trichocladiopsis]